MNSQKYDKSYFETKEKTKSLPYTWEAKRYHLEIVAESLKYFRPKMVLDIGCAKGFLVYLFLEKNIPAYGIDISKYAIENSFPKIRNRLFVADIEKDKIPFKDNFFDLIVGLELLEHLNSFDNLMKECFRVLKDGGYLFFTTPQPGSFDAKGDITHVNVCDYKFWEDLFLKSGFKKLDNKEKKLFLKEFIKNYKKFISFTTSDRKLIKFLYKFGAFGRFIRKELQVYINFFSPFKATQILIFKKCQN